MRERNPRRNERGIALILALFALLLLTAVALHLAALTAVEMQSATNYRWSLKARYNAEAGIAIGQNVLSELSWTYALPAARTPWPADSAEPAARPEQRPAEPSPSGTPSRDFEMGGCDRSGNGMGYGAVLFDGEKSYQDVNEHAGVQLDGAFTLWVRRPRLYGANGEVMDYPRDDVLILTSEGLAPAANPSLPAGQASTIIEVTLYSSQHGVTIGPPYRSESWREVIGSTTPYKFGSPVCR